MNVTVADLSSILSFLSNMIYSIFTMLDTHYLGYFSLLDYVVSFQYLYLTYSFIFSMLGNRGSSNESDNA